MFCRASPLTKLNRGPFEIVSVATKRRHCHFMLISWSVADQFERMAGTTNALAVLKNKLQVQKDELEKNKDILELKCKEIDEEKAKISVV